MEANYYAKSADESGNKTTNQEHLKSVAELAMRFGEALSMPRLAWTAGILHDFGKYSEAFQSVLNGTATNIDHAICSAAFLYGANMTSKHQNYCLVAAVTAAHHSTLRAFDSMVPELREICLGKGSGICASGKRSALLGPAEYSAAQRAFASDFPDFKFPKLEQLADATVDERMLRARMLLSCLVDADYTVSSGHVDAESENLEPEQLLRGLYNHMRTLRENSDSDKTLNSMRDEVFRQCGDAGEMAPGLFTLTAPTGIGKTMALLHFALRHCAAYGKRRIILVLPFLTLTEQSQREYGKLVPHILADHSQSRLSEEERELANRWDAPFIITTSVRFFESLFAARPKDCRKLHSIAQSVVVFDEAQSLPTDLAAATMRSAAALCREYGCTMVFSTATQPDFGSLPELPDWQPREILRGGRELYAVLRRTRVRWKLDRPMPLQDIAAEMSAHNSACAIVNLRRHAVNLFEALKESCPEGEENSLFFLTTDLCPAHRSEVIDTIKSRLSDRIPCRVVATQCIEAGVDLDFEDMYRALAPLESIIQAAGRCNRNGTLPGGGTVLVFIPEDKHEIYPSKAYRNAAETVKLMCASSDLDIHDPETIAEYYRRLFRSAKDKTALTAAIASEDYESVDREYRLIEKQGVRIVVPYDQALYRKIRLSATKEGVTPELIRQAAPITVSSFNEELVRQHCEQIPCRKRLPDAQTESDFYILSTGHEGQYLQDMGLQLSVPDTDDDIFFA